MTARITPIPCPACMHEETMRARLPGREACHDELTVMRFAPRPSRPGGQIVSKWDGGSWTCQICELRLTPHEAGVLLDAALMHVDPDCDSIVDGVHEDTRRAFRGGRP